MNKQTLSALKASIQKWENVVENNTGENGADDCALCGIYNNEQYDCIGCPVHESTGKQFCNGSPYVKWFHVAAKQRGDGLVWHNAASKQAAQDMLDFLKSLLPEGQS